MLSIRKNARTPPSTGDTIQLPTIEPTLGQITASKLMPTTEDLSGFVGRYRSEELDTAYEIRLEEGALVAWHVRHGTLELHPDAPGRFDSRIARFQFGERDGVPGVFLSNGRALDVWFARQ